MESDVEMRVEHVRIDSLTEDPENVRLHSKANIDAIKTSLSRFGQQKPIVTTIDGVVIAGNGTLRAARLLGWERIAIVRSTLVGNDATAFAITDNRSAEIAEWDWTELSKTMGELMEDGVSMSDLGWTAGELLSMQGKQIDEVQEAQAEKPRISGKDLGGLKYHVIIDCENEEHQRETLTRIEQEGFKCRALIL